MKLTLDDLRLLCARALRGAGFNSAQADAVALASVAAERRGHTAFGAGHLRSYVRAIGAGAIDGSATPTASHSGQVYRVDAASGFAQAAFCSVVDEFTDGLKSDDSLGLILIRNSFTAGEMAFFTGELAQRGLIGIAMADSPALVAMGSDGTATTGTNPMSFAAPVGEDGAPVLFDQAISPASHMKVRKRAEAGEPLPEGWSVDAAGNPTTDAQAALEGALLPAGYKMGNIAQMVEILAGFAGGNFSVEAPAYDKGSENPHIGVFILAIRPGADYLERLAAHVNRLEDDFGVVYPGRRRAQVEQVEVDDELHSWLTQLAQQTEPA